MFASPLRALRVLRVLARRTSPLMLAMSMMLTGGIVGTLCILFIVLFLESPGHNPLADSYQQVGLGKEGRWKFFYLAVVVAPLVETFLAQVLVLEPAKFHSRRYRRYLAKPGYLCALAAVYVTCLILLLPLFAKLSSFIMLSCGISLGLALVFFCLSMLPSSRLSVRSSRRLRAALAIGASITLFASGHLAPGVENLAILIGSGIAGGAVFAFGYFVYTDPLKSFFIVWLAHLVGNFVVSSRAFIPESISELPRAFFYGPMLLFVLYAWISEQRRKRKLLEQEEQAVEA